MLKIDRHAFLALAFGMNIGACYTSAPPPGPRYPGPQQPQTAPRSNEAAYGPTQECVGWDPSGECTQWEPRGESAYAPAQECVGWDATGECTQWEPRGRVLRAGAGVHRLGRDRRVHQLAAVARGS